MRSRVLWLSALLAWGCTGAPPKGAGTSSVVIPAASPLAREVPHAASRGAGLPPIGAPTNYRPPAVEGFKLPSGLTVATVHDPSWPRVSLRWVVEGWASPEPGVAFLAAQLIAKGGSRALSPSAVDDALAAMGAHLSVDVGIDTATFSLTVGRAHLPKAFALLSSLARSPRLGARELGQLAGAATRAAKALRGPSLDEAALTQALYALGDPRRGRGIPKAGLGGRGADVKKFVEGHWVPQRTTLLVVGDATPEVTRRLARANFGALRKPATKSAETTAATERAMPASRTLIIDTAVQGPVPIAMAWAAPTGDAKEVLAARIALGALAHRMNGSSSEVPELASVRGQAVGRSLRGPLMLGARAPAPRLALTVRHMLEALTRPLDDPMASEEARLRASHQLRARARTVGGLADILAEFVEPSALPAFPQLGGPSPSAADIAAQASVTLDPKRAVLVVWGPVKELTAGLSALGRTPSSANAPSPPPTRDPPHEAPT